jgi:ribosome-binding factor A
MILCRPLAPPRLLAVAPPVCARAPCSPRPPSLSLRVVRCMAKEKRVRMVAKQIQRELADMLTRDPVLQRAVLPEAALGADRYLSSLTTIADVELSNDLQVRPRAEMTSAPRGAGCAESLLCAQVCKVYVSVFGDERGKKVAIEGLKARTKYVRSQIGKRMKLRLTPEIRFIEDESMERGSRVRFKFI